VIVQQIAAMDWHELFAVAADPEIWARQPVTNRHTEPVFRVFFDGQSHRVRHFLLLTGSAASLSD
jgi:hypothetical protein